MGPWCGLSWPLGRRETPRGSPLPEVAAASLGLRQALCRSFRLQGPLGHIHFQTRTAASPTPAFATAGPWVGRERPRAVGPPPLPTCSGPRGSTSLPHLPCPAHPESRPTAGLQLGVRPFPTHHPARSQPNIHAAHCVHPASSPPPGQLPPGGQAPGTLLAAVIAGRGKGAPPCLKEQGLRGRTPGG